MRVAIAGAGGHAKVVGDALLAAGDVKLVSFLDDNPRLHGSELLGYPVGGPIADWRHGAIDAVVVAIGDNLSRKMVFESLVAAGASLLVVIHPRCVLARGTRVGAGTVVFANVCVNVDSVIGENVILNTGCSVDHDCYIASHVHLGPGVRLAGGVRIGEGAFLGIGAVVLPGVVIGAWATVGAGAVVLGDVREGVTVVGVPAKEVKQWRR
jgi:sugar O-acyltransferase (sialic acid O-acetyltransferase NeuD family)